MRTRVPGKINHTLGQADLAQPFILVVVRLVVMTFGVIEDELVAKRVVVGGQIGRVDGQGRELGGHNSSRHGG